MATDLRFDELALKYVLADQGGEKDQRRAISEQAARAIEESTNRRITVGQWVASVSRWMQSCGEDDLIARAAALDFLASTLQVLSRKNDTLSRDQVTLLVTFFCSLFENDHKAGVAASTKALRQLVLTMHFESTLGGEILQSVCKLGDDFKLQAPATRLEIYHLFSSLLEIPAVVGDLENRHGNARGFIHDLLNMCRNERDPENLMIWFAILKAVLQDFDIPTDVTSEIFKAFSAYFPISLRPSATPSSVTTDNLKVLDKVDQTVAVKVDILHTLDACIIEFDIPRQSVVPHADHIWGSLKYEVRNGEIQDIIKATLKVLCSLTQRLDGEDLNSFVDSAWRDLKEDISDSRYTAQAGRLLVAVVGATPHSFALLMPRALEHIKKNIKHNTSVLHKRHLIALMSSLVKLRLHLASDFDFIKSKSEEEVLLSDDLFGDSLFHDLYLPFWEEHSAASSPLEYIGILQEAMQGLGALVGQKSSGKGPIRRLCSDSTCKAIFGLIAKPVIICPLSGFKYFDLAEESVPQGLLDAGQDALRNAIPLYPPSFQYLLLQYLASIKYAFQLKTKPHDLRLQIRNVSGTLCELIHSGTLEPDACWLNEAALVNTFLQGLQWILSERADPEFLVAIIDAIHVTLKCALKQSSLWDTSPELTEERFYDLVRLFETNDVPQINFNRLGTIEALATQEAGSNRPRRAYCLFVVQQLYRRFTCLAAPTLGAPRSHEDVVVLSADLDRKEPDLILREDVLLNQVGQLAVSVVGVFSEEEQSALSLDLNAFSLFHRQSSTAPVRLNYADNFRTAPLSLGIIQGLWPGAIRAEIQHDALYYLATSLAIVPSPCSRMTRAAMDAMFCVLSNKYDVGGKHIVEWGTKQECLAQGLISTMTRYRPSEKTNSKLQAFRSILHFLAGDVARPLMGTNHNSLLDTMIECASADITMGRQLSQDLGLIVMPRNYLSDANHAVRKKLSLGWFYHKYIYPNLNHCFPRQGVDERVTVNYAVGTFSMLQYLDYHIYTTDIDRIVRIGVIFLSTFKVGVETESLLVVILHILEREPNEIRGHLTTLIQGLVAIYEMARNMANAACYDPNDAGYKFQASRIKAVDCNPIPTRMYTLRFFQKLTESGYDSHLLLPYRRDLLRPLAIACGDPVREIRRIALQARQAWEGLD
ncbi:hypothetical protein NUW58_g37 [Xylaria curta]|uniref:Uncharacterized protein n=1 Tax=Xylaria curta TaxID=42375 RepID=A0ACC1PQT5_9PEZI|nr:hypothetical protein NUW58_g37 [Xylaria curta]